MVVRYQAGPPQGPPLLDPHGLRGLSVPPALMGGLGGMTPQGSLQGPMGPLGSIPLPQASLGSLGSAPGPGGSLAGVVRHSSLPALTHPSSLGSGLGQGHSDPGEATWQLPQACTMCPPSVAAGAGVSGAPCTGSAPMAGSASGIVHRHTL